MPRPIASFLVPMAEGADFSQTSLYRSLTAQHRTDWEALFFTRTSLQRVTKTASVDIPRALDDIQLLSEALNHILGHSYGMFVAVVGEATELYAGALTWIHDVIDAKPMTDLLYADEKCADSGEVSRKPVFSPEWLRSQDYMGSLRLFRRTLIDEAGGFYDDVDGAEVYDLTLRSSTIARAAERIPFLLSTSPKLPAPHSWRVDEDTTLASIETALKRYLDSTGGGSVHSVGRDGLHDTRRHVAGAPLVSIVIPTRGDSAFVQGENRCLVVEAVRSVIERTTYSNFEIVVVIDDVAPAQVARTLIAIAGDRIRFVPWSAPFSFSAKMNLGVIHSRGQFLVFLNDDVEVISSDWLTAMLALGQRPEAGLVGAMLYFEDDLVQHAGHAYYRLDVTHIGLGSDRNAAGPNGAFLIEREVDGVTAACALMKRDVFFEVGGFSPLLPGNFNDVDLCMKVASRGYQSYFTPHAELYHYESKSRDPKVASYELDTAWGRWQHLFYDSPHWPENPHQIYRQ